MFLTKSLEDHADFLVLIFQNRSDDPHPLFISETKSVTSKFFSRFWNSFAERNKSFKQIDVLNDFRQ